MTTLVVPGLNDGETELNALARFIADELGPNTPWHILRFFPNYKMSDGAPTTMQSLERACQIGREAGLSFVYLSNLLVRGMQDTRCQKCGDVVIARTGSSNSDNKMKNGRCRNCHSEIPGQWFQRQRNRSRDLPGLIPVVEKESGIAISD